VKDVDQAAQASVGKACGLAGSAIILAVVSLSFDPVLASRSGAMLTLVLSTTLVICASAITRSPGELKTLWLFVDERKQGRPSDNRRAINHARRHAMLWFAAWSALASVLFAMAAIGLSMLRDL
jgi:hypothetical protein